MKREFFYLKGIDTTNDRLAIHCTELVIKIDVDLIRSILVFEIFRGLLLLLKRKCHRSKVMYQHGHELVLIPM